MADILNIKNSTIVNGTTASGYPYLIAELNGKHVGIPVFKFEDSTPNIDLVELVKTDFVLNMATLYDYATSYGIGLAFTVNNSAFAFPLYKVEQNPNNFINLRISEPTLVTNLIQNDGYVVASLDKDYFGVPLYKFSGVFMGDETLPSSAIEIKTKLVTNLVQDKSADGGSTTLNPKIKSYSKLIERVKRSLGWPNVSINLCDENIVEFIDQAIEYYTKYAGYTEEYLIFSTSLYKKNCGIKLDELFSVSPELKGDCHDNGKISFDYDLNNYRKVIDVFSFEQGDSVGINTLFTLEQALVQQTYYGYMLGNTGFDLVTWEVLKGWLDTRKKVLAQTPHIRFDNRSQVMRIIPPPYEGQNYFGVIGCYVERPIKDLISEAWVIEYTLALTAIALGRIYGKFGGMALPIGGGTINYSDNLSYGLKRKEELEKELYTGYGFAETAPPAFFVG
jgi:hypothetical protein